MCRYPHPLLVVGADKYQSGRNNWREDSVSRWEHCRKALDLLLISILTALLSPLIERDAEYVDWNEAIRMLIPLVIDIRLKTPMAPARIFFVGCFGLHLIQTVSHSARFLI